MTLHGGGLPPLEDVTCKFCELEMALPGFGFKIVTEKFPADAAFPLAVNCVAETNVVASGEPENRTCAPLTNPLPLAVTVNAPEETEAGEIPVSTGMGFSRVTVPLPLPETVASTALTARTVTVFEPGTLPGAVYKPEELIVPVVALPPVTPFTCQVTELFEEPVTVALNDCDAPARTFAVPGETETETVDPPEFVGPLVVPVHPAREVAAKIANICVGRRNC